MKIPYSDYAKVKKMTYNEFARWLNEWIKQVYEMGVKEGESTIDEIDTPEKWETLIDNTPKAKEMFSVWQYDDLQEKLSKSFARENVDRIMDIITKSS